MKLEHTVAERFLRYVQIDTQADPNSETTPSSEKQKNLSKLLVEELLKMGMKEYISNGSLLGWLLDLSNGAVHVFRNDGSENVVQSHEKKLSGGSILRGYELDLNSL